MARLRKKLSALVLWCAFLALYLGGALMLMLGLYLAYRDWWAAFHQHAGPRAIGMKSAELFVLALGLILVLIVPVFERQSVDRSRAWRTGRRSDSKIQNSELERDCFTVRQIRKEKTSS